MASTRIRRGGGAGPRRARTANAASAKIAPARRKRTPTPVSGEKPVSAIVIAYQVVPQIAHIAAYAATTRI